jgi:hypothetical protein
MKTIITPDFLAPYSENKLIIQISQSKISFSKPLTTMLDLKPGSKFVFEEESNKLFYRDVADDTPAFQIQQVNAKGGALTNGHGLNKYLEKLLKKQQWTFRFTTGEFKEGRRELTLIAQGNYKKKIKS